MKNIDKELINNLILKVVKEIGHEKNINHLINARSETELYGRNGYLDSLMLVRLIVDIEEHISSEFEREIVIADERAMSKKTSPFKSIATLTDYVKELLNKTNE